jgi:glycogen debranching enzyme
VEIIERPDSINTNFAFENKDLHTIWQKALHTLQSLQTPLGITASGQDDHFHAIFGRDSLWTVLLAMEAGRLQQETALQDSSAHFVPYQTWLHELTSTVLRGLASLQGKVVNDRNEEQPGRIVHEFWDPIPQRMIAARWPVMFNGRYYGAFDTTFLYLITLARVVDFYDDQALLEDLWPAADAAFHWMLDWSDHDEDGLVEYAKRNPEGIGLDNQVWKDSGEALKSREHTPIAYPVAWVEVQGYAWAAYKAYAELAKSCKSLDHSMDQEIQRRMLRLQEGLQRFWLHEERFPAIAIDGEKNLFPVVSSNPGHLLWSGCLEKAQAEQICKRLMQSDILTPWGLRTLSERAYYYNPLVYHCGAIWPFDNAVIAKGMRSYGFETEARVVAERVLHAMLAFDDPVELYTVQPSSWIRSHRIDHEWFLADYYHACKVQAWTAAATLYLSSMFLVS